MVCRESLQWRCLVRLDGVEACQSLRFGGGELDETPTDRRGLEERMASGGEKFTRGMNLGPLRIEQTADWLREPKFFSDTVRLEVSEYRGGVRSYTEMVVSLDDLVEFVTRVRTEWRAGYDAARTAARTVKS